MSSPTAIGILIVRSPEVCSGRPRIAGTGVSVRRVVGWYKLGLSPEEIADRIGHLTLAQGYAALAYYHANCDEVETDLNRTSRHWHGRRPVLKHRAQVGKGAEAPWEPG